MHPITRTLAAGVTGLALAFGTVAVPAGSASAAAPNTVTKAEYAKIHRGMPQREVERIFGTKGWGMDGGAGWFSRGYKASDGRHKAVIVYRVFGRWPNLKYRVYEKGWTTWRPAQPNPVTKAEYAKVRKGMTMKQVHRIFDITGRKDLVSAAGPWGPATQRRVYRAPGVGDGRVYVGYVKSNGVWRVEYKWF